MIVISLLCDFFMPTFRNACGDTVTCSYAGLTPPPMAVCGMGDVGGVDSVGCTGGAGAIGCPCCIGGTVFSELFSGVILFFLFILGLHYNCITDC
jgi:hypothetical protein